MEVCAQRPVRDAGYQSPHLYPCPGLNHRLSRSTHVLPQQQGDLSGGIRCLVQRSRDIVFSQTQLMDQLVDGIALELPAQKSSLFM